MEGIRDCLEQVRKRQASIVTSVITYTEITSAKVPVGVDDLFEELMQRPNCVKIGVDMRIAKLARSLRNHYLDRPDEYKESTLSQPDSIHVATAIFYKVTEFHTFDERDAPYAKALGLLPLSGNVGGYNLRICRPPEDRQGNLDLAKQPETPSTEDLKLPK
jgi:predicted nucleic acid-binding protein